MPNTGRTSLVQTGDPKTVFETLFKYPRVVARHGGGPSVEARERFLTPCVSQGLAGATLLRHAPQLLVTAERIDITKGGPTGSPPPAATRSARQPSRRRRIAGLVSGTIAIVCKPSSGRGNSLSKRPRHGCTSWDVWKNPNPRPYHLQTGLPTLPPTSAMSAAYPRPPSAVRAGRWRSS